MKRYAPHIATFSVFVVAAVALHIEHTLAYAAVAAVILGSIMLGTFSPSIGTRAAVLLLVLDAFLVPFSSRKQVIAADVYVAMFAFFVLAIRYRRHHR